MDERWRIPAPVGIYNLGNTCYQSAVLQCLIHCVPLQRYFLREIGHHYVSSAIHRSGGDKDLAVCLASEMDKLLLQYQGSAMGLDILGMMDEASKEFMVAPPTNVAIAQTFGGTDLTAHSSLGNNRRPPIRKGDPIAATSMLAATWQAKGMEHLAGYEQRDAHEFLHGILDMLDKHTQRYRDMIFKSISVPRPNNSVLPANQCRKYKFFIRRYVLIVMEFLD